MTTDKIEPNFHEALIKVIDELNAPKNQVNNFGHYKYRNAEDIIEAVKPLLRRELLRMKISDTVEQVGSRYYVKSTVTVIGYGEEDEVSAYAREAETKKGMDEAQITGASSSYARKYALNGMFAIDDTKDADTDEHYQQSPRTQNISKDIKFNPATDDQRIRITKFLTNEGITVQEIPSILETQYDIPVGQALSYDQAENILKDLEKEPF